jgi:hypothetical protein
LDRILIVKRVWFVFHNVGFMNMKGKFALILQVAVG